MRQLVTTSMLVVSLAAIAAGEPVRISLRAGVGGCHDIVVKGPDDSVGTYRESQARKGEKAQERIVTELSRWVWVNVVLKPNVDSCSRPNGIPKSVVLFEKGKEDTAVLTVELTTTPVKLDSGIDAELKAFNAIGKIPIEDMRVIVGRELVVYLVYVDQPREGTAWKQDYAAKILKGPTK